jgi:hypothetical protein
MICDTYFLMDVMGCVKEAYIRAPPLPLYYDALAAVVQEARGRQEEEEALDRQSEAGRGERVSAGSSSPLAIFKERLVLYDNDHAFDAKQLSIKGGCVLQELDGMTRDQMFDAYKRAVVVIDLWLPGAETVTAEGAMFDCCILVPNEMNGANERDFPIASDLKIRRLENGHWNYTQISDLLNRALDEYDEFVGEFRALKRHVMALPDAFQASVHRYFSNDIHFVAAAFTKEEQELVLPWAVSVLMNYPLASIDILVHNRMQFGLAYAGVLEVLRHRGIKQSITVSDALPGYGAQAYLGRSSGPRTFNGAVRESSLTCFADPRTTVLRPDLLELVEANSSAWDLLNAQLLTGEDRGGEVGERSVGSAKEGGGGGGVTEDTEPRMAWVLECMRASDFSVIPQETGWADFEQAWRLRHWNGFLFFNSSGRGGGGGAGRGSLAEENCWHLKDMYTNSIYRGVFPYFSSRYRYSNPNPYVDFYMNAYTCACVYVCVRVCARVRACMRACIDG